MSCARAVGAKAFDVWSCAECGKEARATVHQMRKTYCSMDCMAKGYAVRLQGVANPNHRDIQPSTCQKCGCSFQCKTRNRKFCSHSCYAASRVVLPDVACANCATPFRQQNPARKYCSAECFRAATPKKQYIPTPRAIHMTACEGCGDTFRSARSSDRKFCSYPCFVSSGGTKRAGEAAVRAMKKYGAKKDANHKEIFAYIEIFAAVKDLSTAGFGVPDGIAWVGGGWHLFDVKNPNTGYGRRGLNPIQKKWADDWRGGPVYLIYNVQDAENFVKARFAALKKFPDDAVTP